MRVVSLAALAAAAFGAFIAFVTYQVMCFAESGGSTMCPDGEPTTTMTAQLVVGLAGLIPAAVMVRSAFRGARRAAVVALVVGLAVWIGWAILNDAAVHEWGPGMRLL
jgi:Na+/proline symporter